MVWELLIGGFAASENIVIELPNKCLLLER
jgi:hypothetical protein